MNGPVRRLSIGVFTAFFVLLLAVTWFQVVRADALKADPRNARPAFPSGARSGG